MRQHLSSSDPLAAACRMNDSSLAIFLHATTGNTYAESIAEDAVRL